MSNVFYWFFSNIKDKINLIITILIINNNNIL